MFMYSWLLWMPNWRFLLMRPWPIAYILFFLQSLTDTADHVKNYRPKLIVLTGNPATRFHHMISWKLLININPSLQATISWLCQSDNQETFTSHLRPCHLGELYLQLWVIFAIINWVKASVTRKCVDCGPDLGFPDGPIAFFTPIPPIQPNRSQIPEFGLRAGQWLIPSFSWVDTSSI